jgi:hypothetical protein
MRLDRKGLDGLRRALALSGLLPALIGRRGLMPDLTRGFGVVPDLARRLCARRTGGRLPVRDDWRDGTPDPERAQPLLSFDISGVGSDVVLGMARLAAGLAVTRRPILTRFAVSRLAPALSPPGHI